MKTVVEPPRDGLAGASGRPQCPAPGPLADPPRVRTEVLGAPIDAVTRGQALERLLGWAERRESRVVSICNVHSVVTASRERGFMDVLRGADMATPDGMPVVWMMRALGHRAQERVAGPDLMWDLCDEAQRRGVAVFLYGSTPATLSALIARLHEAFPALRIAGHWAPPFRPLSAAEDAADVARINASGAQLVFVGLGCPRQEVWMHDHRGRVEAVMIGVGAAFDFHGGTVRRAPRWMRASGLEWLHRLGSEPRRLWRRYLDTNSAFVVGAARQLIGRRRR
jgi:N-acetylglucosaminyldiphosphoundecaprenol N-acetyl-beta-D-mannosaminyltransferase